MLSSSPVIGLIPFSTSVVDERAGRTGELIGFVVIERVCERRQVRTGGCREDGSDATAGVVGEVELILQGSKVEG